MTRVPRRFGYNKDVRGLLLTDPIAVPEWKNRRHEVFYYLNLVGEVERRILGRDTVSQVASRYLVGNIGGTKVDSAGKACRTRHRSGEKLVVWVPDQLILV